MDYGDSHNYHSFAAIIHVVSKLANFTIDEMAPGSMTASATHNGKKFGFKGCPGSIDVSPHDDNLDVHFRTGVQMVEAMDQSISSTSDHNVATLFGERIAAAGNLEARLETMEKMMAKQFEAHETLEREVRTLKRENEEHKARTTTLERQNEETIRLRALDYTFDEFDRIFRHDFVEAYKDHIWSRGFNLFKSGDEDDEADKKKVLNSVLGAIQYLSDTAFRSDVGPLVIAGRDAANLFMGTDLKPAELKDFVGLINMERRHTRNLDAHILPPQFINFLTGKVPTPPAGYEEKWAEQKAAILEIASSSDEPKDTKLRAFIKQVKPYIALERAAREVPRYS